MPSLSTLPHVHPLVNLNFNLLSVHVIYISFSFLLCVLICTLAKCSLVHDIIFNTISSKVEELASYPQLPYFTLVSLESQQEGISDSLKYQKNFSWGILPAPLVDTHEGFILKISQK